MKIADNMFERDFWFVRFPMINLFDIIRSIWENNTIKIAKKTRFDFKFFNLLFRNHKFVQDRVVTDNWVIAWLLIAN